jgi:dienelactone hydrolase
LKCKSPFFHLTISNNSSFPTDITGPGPTPATAGIIFIYDVFGFLPQTLRGADRLAASLSCLVLVPDILNGQYAEEKWLAPTASRAEQDAAAKYRAALAVPTFVSRVMAVARDAKNKFPHVARWGAFGLCWGGKVSWSTLAGMGLMWVI